MEAASNAGENEGIAPASKQQGLEKDSKANGETRRLIFFFFFFFGPVFRGEKGSCGAFGY